MSPKVLIYEGMDGHGECLSSYYYFFKKLGYEVEFALKERIVKEKPLWMIDDAKIYSIVKRIDKSQHLDEIKSKIPRLFSYDFYFIATMNKHTHRFAEFLSKNKVSSNRILFQDHLNYKYYLDQTGRDMKLSKNGFTLGMVDHQILPQLSPIKSIQSFEHKKATKDFDKNLNIFIGGLSHIHFKNFEKFVQVTEELNEEGYNIKINVTGIRELGNYILPDSKCINYLGRIGFEDMSKQYLTNDLLFVLFDTEPLMCPEDHQTFLDGRVSGSRNMSIMYKIPLVVQKQFQLAWGMNDSNSISYVGHDYKKVLLDLFKVKKEQYNLIMDNLHKKEKEELDLGLNNLKNKIESLKSIPEIKASNKKHKINKYF